MKKEGEENNTAAPRVWECSVQWADTGLVQHGVFITEDHDAPEGYDDDAIFFYGLDAGTEVGKPGGEFTILEANLIS